MDNINLADNIVRLRHERKITQTELAEFVGVTKASVSKWETKQSIPDVMILPQLATYFGVTIDELMGYEPNLTKGQAKILYRELTNDFANKPFEEVMEKSRMLMKEYYTCYLFMFLIAQLWVNHYGMAASNEEKLRILTDASDLCERIISNSTDHGIVNDTIMFKSAIDLLLGKADDVINALEDIYKRNQIVIQSETLLTRAYQIKGETKKAYGFTQANMYFHILAFVTNASQLIENNMTNMSLCEKVIDRCTSLMDIFNLDNLHFNIAGIFYYQAAMAYLVNGRNDDGLDMLEKHVKCICYGFETTMDLSKGDDFFDDISHIYDEEQLFVGPPRDLKVVIESVLASLQLPVFNAVMEDERYKRIISKVKNIKVKKEK